MHMIHIYIYYFIGSFFDSVHSFHFYTYRYLCVFMYQLEICSVIVHVYLIFLFEPLRP